MAIIQALCTSFKRELLLGVHNFASHTFKIALYTGAADLSASTSTYTTAAEVVGAGYDAGGKGLVAIHPVTEGSAALASFGDVTWPGSSFVTRGALIYNSSVAGNPAVAVLDFGADRLAGVAFTVTFPPATAAAAIVRIA